MNMNDYNGVFLSTKLGYEHVLPRALPLWRRSILALYMQSLAGSLVPIFKGYNTIRI